MKNVVYKPSRTVAARPALDLPKAAPKEESVTVVDRPATLTNKPISLAPAERREELKRPADKGDKPPTRSLLEFEVGDVSYSGRFSVRVFVNKQDANLQTSIKDEHFIGTFGALDSHAGGARGEKETTAVFLVNVSGPISNFYKVAPPGKPFTLTLVPVGTAGGLKDFRLTVKKVTLAVYE
jgi:hypothetical protein